MVVGEPAPGAGQSGLHLVKHEQQAPVVAQLAHRLEVAIRRNVDAALALDGLQQHRRGGVVDGLLQFGEVVPGNVAEALGQGLEDLVLFGLAGGVQRGQRPPVERPARADHGVAAMPGPSAGQLDSALVGLRPAVGKEHLTGRPADQAVDGAGHVHLGLGGVQVGHVAQGAGLLSHRLGHPGVGVAQADHGDTAEKVQVAGVVAVPEPAALAPHEHDRGRAVGGHERARAGVCAHCIGVGAHGVAS